MSKEVSKLLADIRSQALIVGSTILLAGAAQTERRKRAGPQHHLSTSHVTGSLVLLQPHFEKERGGLFWLIVQGYP